MTVITEIDDDADVSAATKMADIRVVCNGIGTNVLSLTGDDAAQFTIAGTELYLNAGVTLSGPDSWTCTVNVNNDARGPGVDATYVYVLTVNAAGGVAWRLRYHSDEMTPTTGLPADMTAWTDSGDLVEDLTISTAPTVTTTGVPSGHTRWAFFDSGASEYVSGDMTGNSAAINADTQGTIFIRFNIDDLSASRTLFGISHDTQSNVYLLVHVDSSGLLDISTRGGGDYRHRVAGAISINTDYLICLRQSADGTGVNIWINGSSQTVTFFDGGGDANINDWIDAMEAKNTSDLERIRIGAREHGGGAVGNFMDGEIGFIGYTATALGDTDCASTTPETL